MDAVLHALADPHRRTMMQILRHADTTAGQLAEALPIARPGVSRHLRVLREAGLVEVRQDGRVRTYSLRVQPLAEIDTWLTPYRAIWQRRMDDLRDEITRGRTPP
ncbi:ArsR/SmtB family transcription factor [Brachybacterium hainanense]|uniref:ArsR/SmtB family transcription factor n=1 Tax=Brachybacterium hainanense TaxID=1541174 RepID=A0ABV6RH66_9MICO